MLIRWRDKFLEECREWWRLWSTWLAAAWGMLVTAFWNDPGIFKELVDELPAETRAWLSPLVFVVVGGLPIFVRLLKQNKLAKNLPD